MREIQAVLQEYGVDGSLQDVADVLLAALVDRPSLCKGLFAEHLLGRAG